LWRRPRRGSSTFSLPNLLLLGDGGGWLHFNASPLQLAAAAEGCSALSPPPHAARAAQQLLSGGRAPLDGLIRRSRSCRHSCKAAAGWGGWAGLSASRADSYRFRRRKLRRRWTGPGRACFDGWLCCTVSIGPRTELLPCDVGYYSTVWRVCPTRVRRLATALMPPLSTVLHQHFCTSKDGCATAVRAHAGGGCRIRLI
jgi:hypothetical protein